MDRMLATTYSSSFLQRITALSPIGRMVLELRDSLNPLCRIGNPDNAPIAMIRPSVQAFRKVQASNFGTPNPKGGIRYPRANPESVYARFEDICRNIESGNAMARA